jgi:hypothetical protein
VRLVDVVIHSKIAPKWRFHCVLQHCCTVDHCVVICNEMQNRIFITQCKVLLSALRAGSVVLLLLLYAAGVLQVESLHALFHDHQQAKLHTSAQENDLCHRAIYHGEKENDCGHKTHVKKSDRCSLCAMFCSGAHVYAEISLVRIFVHATDYFFDNDFFTQISSGHQKPSRAPPVG